MWFGSLQNLGREEVWAALTLEQALWKEASTIQQSLARETLLEAYNVTDAWWCMN